MQNSWAVKKWKGFEGKCIGRLILRNTNKGDVENLLEVTYLNIMCRVGAGCRRCDIMQHLHQKISNFLFYQLRMNSVSCLVHFCQVILYACINEQYPEYHRSQRWTFYIHMEQNIAWTCQSKKKVFKCWRIGVIS